jgi:hypothetical protein
VAVPESSHDQVDTMRAGGAPETHQVDLIKQRHADSDDSA